LVDRHRPGIDTQGDSPESVVILSNYSIALLMMTKMYDGLAAAKHALDMAERLNDDRARAYARAALVLSSGVTGEGLPEDIRRHSQLAVIEADRTDDGYLHSLGRGVELPLSWYHGCWAGAGY
jgi:hypothetical protein